MPQEPDLRAYFELFNEVGILAQLSRAMLEARLPDGVLLPHFTILNHLVRVRDGRTPLEMARAFQVPKTTMSHNVAVVARHGWVELRPNPDDARSKRVWLTGAGRAFREKAISGAVADFAALRLHLTPERAGALAAELAELRRVLDAMRDGDQPNGSVP
jgi:DNA-binding MarR family transcriptional regulator